MHDDFLSKKQKSKCRKNPAFLLYDVGLFSWKRHKYNNNNNKNYYNKQNMYRTSVDSVTVSKQKL